MKALHLAGMACTLFGCLAFGQSDSGAHRSASHMGTPAASVGAPRSPRPMAGKPFPVTPAQHFECSAGFTLAECQLGMRALQKALSKYQAAQLGKWTWVLVRSEKWKQILRVQRMSPGVPAITNLGSRVTLFDEALVSGPAGRLSELMDIWHLERSALLELAVRHELAHALCNNPNEGNAFRVARLLEKRKRIVCERSGRPRSYTLGRGVP